GTTDITFSSSIDGLVEVCANVLYECDIQFQICKSVEFVTQPNPVIQWLQSCGLFAEVRLSNPLSGAVFNWEKVSGPGELIFEQGDQSRTTFRGNVPGTYTIAITETVGECIGSKTL